MQPLLYDEFVPWYRLLDPTQDHRDEAASYARVLARAAAGRGETLLELGAGAGNNAFHLKRQFRCTLTDLSQPMLDLSRGINPECAHVAGDMRTLRLDRTFDLVFAHDGIAYMATTDDLRAAATTAFTHTRPGGAALFVPDHVRETFEDASALHCGDDGARSLRCLEWTYDPDPTDESYTVDYAFLLRDGGGVRAVHDRHVEGLFTRATWVRVLESAGYRVEVASEPLVETDARAAFLCRRS